MVAPQLFVIACPQPLCYYFKSPKAGEERDAYCKMGSKTQSPTQGILFNCTTPPQL